MLRALRAWASRRAANDGSALALLRLRAPELPACTGSSATEPVAPRFGSRPAPRNVCPPPHAFRTLTRTLASAGARADALAGAALMRVGRVGEGAGGRAG